MLGFGLTVAGIGMGIVFFELVLLVFVILAISKTAALIDVKKNVKSAEPLKTTAAAQAVEIQSLEAEAGNDDDLVAVISAAIASFSSRGMTIKAISRLPGINASAWSQAGRIDTMNLRQI